jgi:hypothetical protein
MNELDALTMSDPAAPAKPCGCKGCHESVAATPGDALDAASLESELDAFLSAAPASEDELAFAGLETELASVDELQLAEVGDQALPTLESVLRIAERYPGLKVTFSF